MPVDRLPADVRIAIGRRDELEQRRRALEVPLLPGRPSRVPEPLKADVVGGVELDQAGKMAAEPLVVLLRERRADEPREDFPLELRVDREAQQVPEALEVLRFVFLLLGFLREVPELDRLGDRLVVRHANALSLPLDEAGSRADALLHLLRLRDLDRVREAALVEDRDPQRGDRVAELAREERRDELARRP